MPQNWRAGLAARLMSVWTPALEVKLASGLPRCFAGLLAFVLLFTLALCGGRVSAAEVAQVTGAPMGCGLRISGVISDGDEARVTPSLDALMRVGGETPVGRRVCLDSPGGSLLEAVRIGEAIAARGLGTAVEPGARCESACAVIFMAGRFAHPESEGNFGPDRVLHSRGKLGFYAPSLAVSDGQYDRAQVNRAYAIALSSISEVIRMRARYELAFPDSLILAMLGTSPDGMTYVDTVGRAAQWQISVARVGLPEGDLMLALTRACVNANGGMRDAAPSGSPYLREAFDFQFAGFGADHVAVRSLGGFRTEGVSPCEISAQAGGLGRITIDDDITDLEPFLMYAPDTPLTALPLTGRGEGAFFASLAEQGRAALTDVSFRSCWIASPEAKVVNVENFVNLRAVAGFDGTVLREMPLGERLRVMGTGTLHTPGGAARSAECREACNAYAMNPSDKAAGDRVQRCIGRNVFWYEVRDRTGQLGYVSRKYLSD